jgi:hypothetical protein
MEPDLIHKQSLILYRLRRQARSDDDSIFWVDARHSAYCCRDFGLGFAGHKVVLDLFVPRAVENNCFRRPTDFASLSVIPGICARPGPFSSGEACHNQTDPLPRFRPFTAANPCRT